MNRQPEQDMALAEQAARWLKVLEHGDSRQQAAFAAWLKESPRHIEEVLCAAAVDKALGRLDAQRWPDVSQYLAERPAKVVPLKPETRADHSAKTANKRWLWMSSAAAAVVCAVGWWTFDRAAGWQHYSTTVGEQRTLTLGDGSLAYVNTHSRLDVKFTDTAREVELLNGEALFKVERDPARPFVVRSGDAVIRVLGTQFNVYRRDTGTVVSVVEGMVEVATGKGAQRLSAGEEAHVSGSTVTRKRKADIAKAQAWRQRRLVFDLAPLTQIAAEFNRYNRETQIRIEGNTAEAKRFSGVFDADDPRSLMKLLATYDDLTAEEINGEIVVHSRRRSD